MLLGELHSQYEQMLQNHGEVKSVNRTRLKDEQFPEHRSTLTENGFDTISQRH